MSLSLRRGKIRGFILLLAATVTLGWLGTGDELFRENQGADAQTFSRPNVMVVMIDDLDKQSIERSKRGERWRRADISWRWWQRRES